MVLLKWSAEVVGAKIDGVEGEKYWYRSRWCRRRKAPVPTSMVSRAKSTDTTPQRMQHAHSLEASISASIAVRKLNSSAELVESVIRRERASAFCQQKRGQNTREGKKEETYFLGSGRCISVVVGWSPKRGTWAMRTNAAVPIQMVLNPAENFAFWRQDYDFSSPKPTNVLILYYSSNDSNCSDMDLLLGAGFSQQNYPLPQKWSSCAKQKIKQYQKEILSDFAVPSANPPVRESATHPILPLESTPVQPYLTNPYFICRWYLNRPILMSTTHTSPFAAGI